MSGPTRDTDNQPEALDMSQTRESILQALSGLTLPRWQRRWSAATLIRVAAAWTSGKVSFVLEAESLRSRASGWAPCGWPAKQLMVATGPVSTVSPVALTALGPAAKMRRRGRSGRRAAQPQDRSASDAAGRTDAAPRRTQHQSRSDRAKGRRRQNRRCPSNPRRGAGARWASGWACSDARHLRARASRG